MNKYKQMKERHRKEIEAFPMFFAFSDQQFAEGMKSLGLEPTDTKAIYRLGGTGGFYRKSDAGELKSMFLRHDLEFDEAIAEDTTGEGFIYDMFLYELANHEYCITYDYEDTFAAVGLTSEEIYGNTALVAGLQKATKKYLEGCEDW